MRGEAIRFRPLNPLLGQMRSEIRQAAAYETDLVAEVLSEAVAWLQSRGIPLWQPSDVASAAIRSDVAAGYYFLALHNDQPSGTFKYQPDDPLIWPEESENEASYIHRVAVKRAFAGGKLSSMMLQWAAERAADEGKQFLRLDCEASRPRLRAIYERFGFVHHSDFQAGPYSVSRYQLSVQDVV